MREQGLRTTAAAIVVLFGALTCADRATAEDKNNPYLHGTCNPVASTARVVEQWVGLRAEKYLSLDWYVVSAGLSRVWAAQFPDDLFVQRENDSWLYQDQENRKSLLEVLETQALTNPGNAIISYRLARLQLFEQAPAVVERLERLVGEHPKFPQARILLATAYRMHRGIGSKHELDQIAAYRSLCPSNAEGFRLLFGLPASDFLRSHFAALGQIVETDVDKTRIDHLHAYVVLARTLAENERATSTAKRWISTLFQQQSTWPLAELESLLTTSEIVGDQEARSRMEKLVLRNHPRSVTALNIREGRYEADRLNATPAGNSPNPANERLARLSHVEAMLETFPFAPALLNARFKMVREDASVSDAAILSAGADLAAVMLQPPRSDLLNPLPLLVVANEYIARRMRLDDVQPFVERSLSAIAYLRSRAAKLFPRSDTARARFLSEMEAQEVLGHGLIAQASSLKKDFVQATSRLRQAEEVLRRMAMSATPEGSSEISLAALAHHAWALAVVQFSKGNYGASRNAMRAADVWAHQTTLGAYRAVHQVLRSAILRAGNGDDVTACRLQPTETEEWMVNRLSLPPKFLESIVSTDSAVKDLRGKTIIVTQWASWCAPCYVQLKLVEQIRRTLEGRHDIAFVSIALDREFSTAQLASRSIDLSMPLLAGDRAGDLFSDFAGIAPVILVIDSAGIIRRTLVGFKPAPGWAEGTRNVLLSVANRTNNCP